MADVQRAFDTPLPGHTLDDALKQQQRLSKIEVDNINRRRAKALRDKKRRTEKKALIERQARPAAKPGVKKAKRRGRPPGSKNKAPAHRGPGRPPLTETQLGLSAALSIATTLHPTDVAVFRKLVEIITPQGPPLRARLLAALGKVFA